MPAASLRPVTVARSATRGELSFRPNGEPAKSSATCTDVAVGDEMTRRPSPVVTDIGLLALGDHLLQSACVVVPFMMSSIDATDGVVTAVPENR